MATVMKRLSALETDLEELQRKKLFIPVLFVTECSKGVYMNQEGAVFSNEAGLQRFASEHGTLSVIIDDTRLERG